MNYTIGTEPKQIISGLLEVQYERYEYEDFLIVLKHRLRKYTGNDEVMFYSEDRIVELLEELRVINLH